MNQNQKDELDARMLMGLCSAMAMGQWLAASHAAMIIGDLAGAASSSVAQIENDAISASFEFHKNLLAEGDA